MTDKRRTSSEFAGEVCRGCASRDVHTTVYGGVTKDCLRDLSERADRYKQELDEVRKELWWNHGHRESLYGDDGELQCSRCPADFKRQPLSQLVKSVLSSIPPLI